MCLPTVVEDEQVSMLANLQRAVGVGAAQGVGGVDGGGGQSLRHAHPHVDAGQVHDDGLRGGKVDAAGNGTALPIMHLSYHGAAEGVGVEVTAEGDDDAGVQHGPGSGLRQPGRTERRTRVNQIHQKVCVCHW